MFKIIKITIAHFVLFISMYAIMMGSMDMLKLPDSEKVKRSISSSCANLNPDDLITRVINHIQETRYGYKLDHPLYEVKFKNTEIEFLPKNNALSWRWSLQSYESVPPVLVDDKVVYDHGNIIEQYVLKSKTIEQQFIIKAPIAQLDQKLKLEGKVRSNGSFEQKKQGWVWKNGNGEVTLGDVTVFDAHGDKLAATMSVSALSSVIEINLSELQPDQYPILVDPEIGTNDFRISKTGVDGDVTYSVGDASVAFNANTNTYLVVWQGKYAGKNDIYGQLFDAEGSVIDGNLADGNRTDIRICNMGTDNSAYDASRPDVAALGNEFFVVWDGDDNVDYGSGALGDNESEIFGQRVDASDGSLLLGTHMRISAAGTDGDDTIDANEPSIAANDMETSYLIIWRSDHISDQQFEIYSQGVDSDGTLIGSNQRISSMGADPNSLYDAFSPDVAWNSTNNQYMVTWHGDHSAIGDGEDEIFIRRVDGSSASHGNTIGNVTIISDMGPDADPAYDASDAVIAYNATDNNYLVVWSGDDDTGTLVDNENEIFGQFVSSLGTISGVGDFFRISSMGPDGDTSYEAIKPGIVYDKNLEKFLVVWSGDHNGGGQSNDEYEIFGQLLEKSGTASGSYFRLSDAGGIGNTTYKASAPTVAYGEGNREFFIAWDGDDNSTTTIDNEFEIWGQRYAVLDDEPSNQATSLGITLITSSSSTVSYTAATGTPDGYLVLRRSGTSPTDVPVDGVPYEVDDVIGSSTVVYVGDQVTFDEVGLSAVTSYYYDIFSYNGVKASLNYKTDSPLQGNATTLSSEPTNQSNSLTYSSVGTSSVSIDFTNGNGTSRLLVARQGAAVNSAPVDGTTYSANTIFGSGDELGSGNYVIGKGTGPFVMTGLSVTTTYHIRVFEFNGSGGLENYNTATSTNNPSTISTISAEPTHQPTALVLDGITDVSISGSFTAAVVVPDGYLVLRRSGTSPTDVPVDGVSYMVDDVIGSSTVVQVGDQVTFDEVGLSASTSYYYDVFSYNGVSASLNYKTDSPLEGNTTTLSAEPTNQANGLTFSSLGTTSVSIDYTNGNGTSRLLVARQGAAVNSVPVDGTTYIANTVFGLGDELGSGNYVIGKGSGPFVMTGLSVTTTYHIRVFEFNGSGGLENYNTATSTNNPSTISTISAEPTHQPTILVLDGISDVSISGSFTAAAVVPDGYLVLGKAGSMPASLPEDGSSYTAGETLGDARVVYSGSNVSFASSSLSPATGHYYSIYSYNGSSTTTNYLTSTPLLGDATTLSTEPASSPSTASFAFISDVAMDLSFDAAVASPDGYLVLRRSGGAPSISPEDGIEYTLSDALGDAMVAGKGSQTTYSNTSLSSETVYHYAIYAYNGSGSTINYRTTDALTGSRTTYASEPADQPASLQFDSHTTTSMTGTLSAAVSSPDGYLVLRNEGSDPTEIPVDGTSYSIGNHNSTDIIHASGTLTIESTSLSAGTNYHYAVYSYNGSGEAVNYRASSPLIVTSITLSPPPNLKNPTQISSSSFVASWNAAKGANSYDLDVSSDDFVSLLSGYNGKSISGSLSDAVSGLSSSTIYKYRVRAVNASGESSNSVEKIATTFDEGSSGLEIVGSEVILEGDEYTVSVSLGGGSGAREVTFYSRGILEELYESEQLSSTTDIFEITFKNTKLDELGLDYYFSVEDGSTSTALIESGFIYNNIPSGEEEIQGLASGGTLASYRLISIPYDLEDNLVQSIFGALGDYDKSKWRLIQYQEGENVDFPAFNRIQHGEGYWFNSTDPIVIKLGAGSVPKYNQEQPFVIMLKSGWNQIGNPYPYDVSWSDVKAANSTKNVNTLKVYDPSTGSFNDSDAFNAWSGGFLFSESALEISFPVNLSSLSGGRQDVVINSTIENRILNGDQWYVPLVLSHGVGINEMIGFGMHPEALPDKDVFDDVMVPRFVRYLEMNTKHENYFSPNFSRDIVPTDPQHNWLFTINSNFKGKTALLQWDPSKFGSNNSLLLLYDRSNHHFLNMKSVGQYQFRINDNTQFEIIYAEEESLWQSQFSALGSPYPNPSNGLVKIPLLIKNSEEVLLQVYDLSGSLVATLFQGNLEGGVYDFNWDGMNEVSNGRISGLYFVNLITSKQSQIKKITLR